MDEFTGRIDIDRGADEVFAFLSDARNMPRYLPTVRQAQPQGGGRIAVDGEAEGHAYHDEGWFNVDSAARHMRWGTSPDYGGELTVHDTGTGRCTVAVRLHHAAKGAKAQRMQQRSGSADHDIRRALDHALGTIKTACEQAGTSGEAADKDAPRSADDLPDSRPFGKTATLNPDI